MSATNWNYATCLYTAQGEFSCNSCGDQSIAPVAAAVVATAPTSATATPTPMIAAPTLVTAAPSATEAFAAMRPAWVDDDAKQKFWQAQSKPFASSEWQQGAKERPARVNEPAPY